MRGSGDLAAFTSDVPMRRLAPLALASLLALPAAAQPSGRSAAPLTVAGIMAHGDTLRRGLPTPLGWDERGDAFYFRWNAGARMPGDSLYRIRRGQTAPERVPYAERRRGIETFDGWQHGAHVYTADVGRKVATRSGDVYVIDRTTGRETRLTQTPAAESGARFTPDGRAVVYRQGDNLVHHDLASGAVRQITDFRTGTAPARPTPSAQQAELTRQQELLFGIVRDRVAQRTAREAAAEADRRADSTRRPVYLAGKTLGALTIDPSGRFVAYTLGTPSGATNTQVPAWVTESGYVEDLNARPKVGQPLATPDLWIQDLRRDTTIRIDLSRLPGASDRPAYRREMGDTARVRRDLVAFAPSWSADGRFAVVEVRAQDYKTRWLTRLDPLTGTLTPFDVQQDDAWVGGAAFGGSGWMADGRTFWFLSEATGWAQLYAADVETGRVRALTSGRFEVSNPRLTRDGRTWLFASTEASAYESHLYAMPAQGGTRTRLTRETGRHQVFDDPREQLRMTLFSTSNAPPDLHIAPLDLAPRRDPAALARLTMSSTDAWRAYPWQEAEIVELPASDGARVPARIFRPQTFGAQPNGAAVLFVHGAGYLQNVTRGWSTYYRETMFHHLLAERGYVVLDLDYRASAGLGRDWRTAISRYMGGRDLQDYVDASRYVGTEFGVDPERVFIYGGSYGGFITLMALFTEPEHFGGGAALRSVTDWAHYNHGYTANILNTPALDTLAWRRSSPIALAEGYQGDPLLIAHGMVDVNVHFQDVVRLAQRFIELGKTGWEMAVYPVEDHGFVEASSWTDEYRRILATIERSVGPNRTREPVLHRD